jgi:vacuolar-type H+-ATPase subunit I/STV1
MTITASRPGTSTARASSGTVPWALFSAGLLIFLIGLLILRSSKAGGAAAIVVGLLLFIAPIAPSRPSKAANADQLNANLKPVGLSKLIMILMVAGGLVAGLGALTVVKGRRS